MVKFDELFGGFDKELEVQGFDVSCFDTRKVDGTVYLEWYDKKDYCTECCPIATTDQLRADKEHGFLTPPDIKNRIERVESQLVSRFLEEGKTYDKEELKEALELFVEMYC